MNKRGKSDVNPSLYRDYLIQRLSCIALRLGLSTTEMYGKPLSRFSDKEIRVYILLLQKIERSFGFVRNAYRGNIKKFALDVLKGNTEIPCLENLQDFECDK